ncbi:MAG: DUF3267 domain-containing protein [Paludibacter sp.]|nr:DUF3267 domain-containing protein [Paludibacter sp.]
MNYKDLLSSDDFAEIASIKHTDLRSFLASEVEKQPLWARIANILQVSGLLAFFLGGFKAFMPFFTHRQTENLWWLFAGLIFTFTILIVLHELIHALSYRMVGARQLSFGMNLKKFIFYVQANQYVLNYKQFKVVALAPVIAIGILSLLGMVSFYNQPIFYFIIPVFAFHTIFCGGDFGLLCFFQNRPDQEIVTFDVKAESKTYFFGRIK